MNADFDGPIADSLEALASKLRKAARVLLDEIADLKKELAELEAENARLCEVIRLYRQHAELTAQEAS